MFRTSTLFGKGDSTGYVVLDQCSYAIECAFPEEIRLPTAEECEATAQYMFSERGMPGCIGV